MVRVINTKIILPSGGVGSEGSRPDSESTDVEN